MASCRIPPLTMSRACDTRRVRMPSKHKNDYVSHGPYDVLPQEGVDEQLLCASLGFGEFPLVTPKWTLYIYIYIYA